jgi:transcription initiation factor IIE alpha subunit
MALFAHAKEYLTCPNCGWQDVKGSWERAMAGEVECPECEAEFFYDTEVTRTFTSKVTKMPPPPEDSNA